MMYNIKETEFDGVYVKYDGESAVIGYKTNPQRERALTLLSINAKKGAFEISQKPHFDTVGPMIDVSRGKVMTVEGIKRVIDSIVKIGMNMLMLYTEDMFELVDYPQFGYLRGRYTVEELKEIDRYGREKGVELIPCMQTFGHLEQYIKTPEGKKLRDTNRVIMAGEDETYKFIEAEIKVMREAFSTERIHLGMDETQGLGTGNYLKKNGYCPSAEIYNEHLARVLEISKKYFKEPMIWSDMVFESPLGVYPRGFVPSQETVDATPKGVDLVFWDYYHTDYDWYRHHVDQHARFDGKTWFGGGVWTWNGIIPNFEFTMRSTKPALEACVKGGVRDVIATMWLSGGCGADIMQGLAGLCIFSEYCYRGTGCTDDDIFEMSEAVFGVDRELFYAIADVYLGANSASGLANAFVFSDPLLNLMHYDIDYKNAIEIFKKAKSTVAEHTDYAFRDFTVKLYDIAITRAEILMDLRPAYKSGDTACIKKTEEVLLPRLLADTKEFYRIFKKMWYANSKTFGIEMTTHDFGGVILRIEDAIELLTDYIDGKTDRIEALEPEILSGLNMTWRANTSYLSVFR